MTNGSIQEARDRIIRLAREIDEYSKSNISPEAFFNEFLKRVVGAVGARGGAVWLVNQADQLEMISEFGLSITGFYENPRARTVNQKLLDEVLSNGLACTYHPGDTSFELPTEDMLILAALEQNKSVVGVVEIFQRNDSPAQARPGFLQFVEQMTGYACRYLDREKIDQAEKVQSLDMQFLAFDRFLLAMHRNLFLRDVAYTAANDGRIFIGCDRLSVVVWTGRTAVVQAISGQATVNRRSGLAKRMTQLSQLVIPTLETVKYVGKIEQIAPRVEEALANFVARSGSRMVMVIPLIRTSALHHDDRGGFSESRQVNRKPVGALVVEQFRDAKPRAGVEERSMLAAEHVGTALSNAMQYKRIPTLIYAIADAFGGLFRVGAQLRSFIADQSSDDPQWLPVPESEPLQWRPLRLLIREFVADQHMSGERTPSRFLSMFRGYLADQDTENVC